MEVEIITLLWFVIIGFAIYMYVLMDGFVLGIGILHGWCPNDSKCDAMIHSVAPVWDGNETWLVLGGAGLFAAFPLAYSILLPAFYIPLLFMLAALIFRGVAFEFRAKASESRYLWDHAFHWGSTVATFAQGVMLGALVQGIAVEDHRYAGGSFDWLSPFSVLTGIALLAGYALLGATWVIIKCEGPLQAWAYQKSQQLLFTVIFFISVVSLWVPFLEPHFYARWFSWPNLLYLSPIPLWVAVISIALFQSLRKQKEILPFLLTIALFGLSYLGLGISLWPNIIPPNISIWEAAAARDSQLFMLVGVVIIIPITLAYTAYTYAIFHGKVTETHYD